MRRGLKLLARRLARGERNIFPKATKYSRPMKPKNYERVIKRSGVKDLA